MPKSRKIIPKRIFLSLVLIFELLIVFSICIFHLCSLRNPIWIQDVINNLSYYCPPPHRGHNSRLIFSAEFQALYHNCKSGLSCPLSEDSDLDKHPSISKVLNICVQVFRIDPLMGEWIISRTHTHKIIYDWNWKVSFFKELKCFQTLNGKPQNLTQFFGVLKN